ncbi:MAG TPA: iron-containing alcohol dehydrogenase [Bacillota bacterium]|nr:iron-containing alcohol dehydrogenase [Bacillota bacterium]HPL52950.1 iron-containing alcohol dehydrogenase [Bacillota bacterium]
MFSFESYIPTRVVFGPGKLNELTNIKLPGKKALICITEDQLMRKLGILDRVTALLDKIDIEYFIFDRVTPNPTRKGVMEASVEAKDKGCDFFIGLGGGSSIDTAKAAAIMMKNPGDLWEYASAGTGGGKAVEGAFPVVTITTTAGTGTECDPWCVITNERTNEKLDFGTEAVFPKVSIIDPELMLTLPRTLTLYQGFDALFHAIECYIANCAVELTNLYCLEAVSIVSKWLPVVAKDGGNLEARIQMSYAANVLCGFAQSLSATTSPHIIGQCMSGLYPNLAHGASLIVLAEEYYKKVVGFLPGMFDTLGKAMDESSKQDGTGKCFLDALIGLLNETEMRHLPMSGFGIPKGDIPEIARISKGIGFGFDRYELSIDDIIKILQKSYC